MSSNRLCAPSLGLLLRVGQASVVSFSRMECGVSRIGFARKINKYGIKWAFDAHGTIEANGIFIHHGLNRNIEEQEHIYA